MIVMFVTLVILVTQVYQAECFLTSEQLLQGVSGVLCFREQIASKLLHFIFGVAELNLTFGGGVVDMVVGGYFSSSYEGRN